MTSGGYFKYISERSTLSKNGACGCMLQLLIIINTFEWYIVLYVDIEETSENGAVRWSLNGGLLSYPVVLTATKVGLTTKFWSQALFGFILFETAG